MEPIIYYVVQVDDCFYQKNTGIPTLTNDEEQAFAFTSIAAAHQLASKVNGSVLTREVGYGELEELSVQQILEYETLPKNEQNRIKSFLTSSILKCINPF